MSVAMALADYIPVFIFLATSVILQRDLYNKMGKSTFSLFSAGTVMVFFSGLYKATWKLLYNAGICDFHKLGDSMMPLQSTGFFLAAAALIIMLTAKRDGKSEPLLALAAPAAYSGTGVFVAFMCSGIAVVGVCLSVVAAKMKKKGAIPLFIFTIIGLFMMGYLSSQDFSNPAMNWLAEGVNILSQLTFLWGTLILHKAGLADFQLKEA